MDDHVETHIKVMYVFHVVLAVCMLSAFILLSSLSIKIDQMDKYTKDNIIPQVSSDRIDISMIGDCLRYPDSTSNVFCPNIQIEHEKERCRSLIRTHH